MKTSQIVKPFAVGLVFVAGLLNFNVSQASKSIAGERYTVTQFTLGATADAGCTAGTKGLCSHSTFSNKYAYCAGCTGAGIRCDCSTPL